MSLLNFFGFTEPLAAYPPSHDIYYESIGRPTTAGVRVDENRAFNYSVCWAATRLLAGTAGWLPFNLYKRLPGGGAEIDKNHGVHRLIHDQPNDDMGAMMFRSRGVNHQVNWGNCFAEIVRNGGGMAAALEPIHSWRIPQNNIKRENGRLVYYVYRADGMGPPQRVDQENMFHVPSITSDDGIFGKGVVSAARESIGKAIGTQLHGSSALNHGGAPPLALKNGKFRDKKDREDFRQQLKDVHSGPTNAGEWLLLPPEAEVQMLGFNLKDSQFIESQQFDIEEISRWYGVPPHLVGHLLRATHNNIEELGISFVKYSLIQWLKLWEQEVWRKLLTKQEQKTHYAKFVVDALERGNLATRTEAGVKKFFNGLWTLDNWAEQEDMNPVVETVEIDGQQVPLGKIRFVQQAMIPLAMAAKGEGLKGEPAQEKKPEEPPETPKPEPEKEPDTDLRAEFAASIAALRQEIPHGLNGEAQALRDQLAAARTVQQLLAVTVLRDVMSRQLSVEMHNVKNIAQTASKFSNRLREFYDKHSATLERSIAEPVAVVLAAAGDGRDAKKVARTMATEHVAESLKQLDALLDCQADELAGRVESCVAKWHEERTVSV